MNEEYRPENTTENNNSNQYNEGFEHPGVTTAPPIKYVTYIPYGYTPKTFEEKKAIKKTAMLIGISLLIMLGITLVWGTAFFLITGKLGIDYQKAYTAIQEPAVMQVLQIVLSMSMFTIPFIIVFKCAGKRISDLIPLTQPKKNTALPAFLFGIAFCAFANIAVSQASDFFKSFGINYNVDFGENPNGVFGFLLTLLSTVIVPAFVEEFACRGIILGSLRRFGDAFAIIVSAILFGAIHGNFDQMPFAFLVGLVLGYIVVKTGSLWISVAVHGFNNLVSVIFDYAFKNVSDSVQNVVYAVFLTICMVLGILGIVIFSKNGNKFALEKSTTEAGFSTKFKWCFTSVLIIIVLCVCIIESCMYF